MYFCYLDESGTAEQSGNTENFVYAGIAIPVETWRDKDAEIYSIKRDYGLEKAEIHAGWMNRDYSEQYRIEDFDQMSRNERKEATINKRVEILTQMKINKKKSKQIKAKEKYYTKTRPYTHLTFAERKQCLLDILKTVNKWTDSRIFFHAIKKTNYDPSTSEVGGIYEDAFHQLVSRFQMFLKNKGDSDNINLLGTLVSDNNESVNKNLTRLMRKFHKDGTFWREVNNIIETPFFVDSQLTGMIQIADVISYGLRRYFDVDDKEFFQILYRRIDRAGPALVGGRHYTPGEICHCRICNAQRYARRW